MAGSINSGTQGTLSNGQYTIGNAGLGNHRRKQSFVAGGNYIRAWFYRLQNVYGYAASNGGAASRWETVGTWITH